MYFFYLNFFDENFKVSVINYFCFVIFMVQNPLLLNVRYSFPLRLSGKMTTVVHVLPSMEKDKENNAAMNKISKKLFIP